MERIQDQIAYCVERGKVDLGAPYPPDMKGQPGAYELTQAAVAEGVAPGQILEEGLIRGMAVVGQKFRENKIFVPEVLIAAKAMNRAMEVLRPFFESNQVRAKGTVVIGTVRGDLHDIGKNIVSMFLKGSGWNVIDLGVNVAPERFVQAARENAATALCMSALLSTTMLNMEEVLRLARQQIPETRILIGGAPVTQAFCDQIGADLYAPDPQGAVDYLQNIAVATS